MCVCARTLQACVRAGVCARAQGAMCSLLACHARLMLMDYSPIGALCWLLQTLGAGNKETRRPGGGAAKDTGWKEGKHLGPACKCAWLGRPAAARCLRLPRTGASTPRRRPPAQGAVRQRAFCLGCGTSAAWRTDPRHPRSRGRAQPRSRSVEGRRRGHANSKRANGIPWPVACGSDGGGSDGGGNAAAATGRQPRRGGVFAPTRGGACRRPGPAPRGRP